MVLSLSEISVRARSGEVLGWGKPQEVENDAANRASEIVFSDTNSCQGECLLDQGESMPRAAAEVLLEALKRKAPGMLFGAFRRTPWDDRREPYHG